MTKEQMQAELENLKAENATLKAMRRGGRAPSYTKKDIEHGEVKLQGMLHSLSNWGVQGATRTQVEQCLEAAGISPHALKVILERGRIKQDKVRGAGLNFHL